MTAKLRIPATHPRDGLERAGLSARMKGSGNVQLAAGEPLEHPRMIG